MPYVVMKRSDIPAGTLQVLDLEPNTSQRNLTVEPPGQTKYVNPVLNDVVVTYTPAAVQIFRFARGLAAWLITNVSDGTGAFAAGTLTIGAGNAVEGDTFTIGTAPVGGPNRTFTFTAIPSSATDVLIGPTEDATANNFVGVFNSVWNGLFPYVGAVFTGAGVVTMTAVTPGIAANAITLASVGVNLAVSGANLAAGADAAALTATQANTIAADILANVLAFGNLTAPAVAATLAAVNVQIAATVATASITAGQLLHVLDILAGRVYQVPKDTQVETAGGAFSVVPAVGVSGGPGFVVGTLRDVFATGSLTLSVAQGELSGFLDSGFEYAGTPGNPNGEAVVVYNDNGTLFTP